MGRGRLEHDGTCRAKPGTGRLDARSGPALGLWPLQAVVFAAAGVAQVACADDVPAAAIVAPASAANELPAVAAAGTSVSAADEMPAVVTYDPSAAAVNDLPAAAYDPPTAAVGNGSAAPRDPFRPPTAGSSPRDSATATVRLSADMPPSSLFSLRQVLQALAALRGLNLVVTPGVEGEIT